MIYFSSFKSAHCVTFDVTHRIPVVWITGVDHSFRTVHHVRWITWGMNDSLSFKSACWRDIFWCNTPCVHQTVVIDDRVTIRDNTLWTMISVLCVVMLWSDRKWMMIDFVSSSFEIDLTSKHVWMFIFVSISNMFTIKHSSCVDNGRSLTGHTSFKFQTVGTTTSFCQPTQM